MRRAIVGCFVLALSVGVAAESLYTPVRVYDTHRRAFSDVESLLADITSARVVLVGEEHDDFNTHRIEREILEGLAARHTDVILSLEMFERDVQEPLSHVLMGHVSEDEFLKSARPWPNYARDYHPLVQVALDQHWDIVAADVPRSIASEVAASGLGVLAGKSAAEKALFAKDVQCPTGDAYFKRFVDAMGGHTGTAASSASSGQETIERFYLAQCLKDETMAESIAQAAFAGAAGGAPPVVVHVTGAFHTDFGQGTTERVRRRLPGQRVVVLTILPVDNLDGVSPDADARTQADYLIYTRKTPGPAAGEAAATR